MCRSSPGCAGPSLEGAGSLPPRGCLLWRGGADGTLAELAAAISAAAGKQITYTDLPAHDLTQVLAGAGLPAELAEVLADADLGMSRGELFTGSGALRRLIGRPTTPLSDAVADAAR
jgi:NAD(P)H dehydrogenase (quinone)